MITSSLVVFNLVICYLDRSTESVDSEVRRSSGVLRFLCRLCSFPYQVVTSTDSKKLPQRGKYHCMFFIKTATQGGGSFTFNTHSC
nr:MAG TPA: hypothetical protein [Caudoviricetes sp.]